tara:strand:+ start:2513 stop:3439 length:927 start_codon:yes stop_codon:yes gene_type:complete
MIDPWTALRAPVWAWAQWRARSLVDVPRPRDAPRAHTPGPDAVDVLIVGSGTASGWGVLTHELGLIGAFCRAVAQRRQGGVTVAGVVEPSMRMSDVTAVLQQQALGTFQVVCLVLGVNDVLALTSRAAWARELARALDEIERSRAGDTQVLVAGIQPLQSIPTFAGRVSRLLARRARQLNELTSAECERRPGVAFVEPPPTPGDVENVYGDSARYAFWAEVLAGRVNGARTPISVNARWRASGSPTASPKSASIGSSVPLVRCSRLLTRPSPWSGSTASGTRRSPVLSSMRPVSRTRSASDWSKTVVR